MTVSDKTVEFIGINASLSVEYDLKGYNQAKNIFISMHGLIVNYA